MELLFTTDRIKTQCTSVKAAKKLFGGSESLAVSLHARINALREAETIKDIIVQPRFRFHKLSNKQGRNLEGYFAIDVKSVRDQWRIIIQPLDDNQNPFKPCYIDQISAQVRIIEITEVSKHYE